MSKYVVVAAVALLLACVFGFSSGSSGMDDWNCDD